MKKLFLSVLVIITSLSSFAQAEAYLKEEVKAVEGSLDIPFKRYELPNGLNVVIHEDHSDPIVHVELTYHVGSARESLGKSGFAHLFEHMMFQGSGHVADEEHFKIVQGAGGTMNGTTNRDRTNYFQTLPKNYLEMALYLESDRMGYLLDSLTKKKFEVQRSTVKNEKDQRYGVPYGMLQETKDLALYGVNGHPYSWPIIGYTDDLDRVTIDDVRKFFLRWYGPNNATLVIAGDVDPTTTINLVNKYFGNLEKCPEVNKQTASKVRLAEETVKSFNDWVYFPLVNYTFPTIPKYHKDEPALDILGDLMAGSKKSIFYQTFIEDREDYLQANVGHPTFELAGEFSVMVVSYPGENIAEQMKQTRDLINSTINKFGENGFSEEDLKRAITERMAGFTSVNESIAGKASILTDVQIFADGKLNVQDMVDAYKAVTKADVMRVYNTYIKNKNAAIVQVLPDPKQRVPGAKYKPVPSFNQYANVKSDPKDIQYQNLVYNRSKENFDRSVRPEIGPAVTAKAPTFWKANLPNGLEVIGTNNPETDRVSVLIEIDGGQMLEGNGNYGLGTAAFTAGMMNEGTQKYTSAEIEEEIGKLGSSISFSAGRDAINGNVRCFKDQLAPTMALLEQRLLYPNFDEKQFKKDKKAVLQSFKSDKTNSGTMATKGWAKLMYGDETVLGESVQGNPSSVSKLSTADLAKFHADNIAPNVTRLVVVGNITKEEFLKSAAFLNNWEKKEVSKTTTSEYPTYETNQIFMINNPSATQSQVNIGYRTIPYDAFGDFYKISIANFPLGGNFNSRINLTLREKYGWTYGARSFATSGVNDIPGYFAMSAGFKRNATDSAIKEAMRIMNDYVANGMTQEELDYTKKSLISSDALKYESSFAKARYLSFISDKNLPADYRQKQIQILNDLTVPQINEIIKKYMKPGEMIILVVGNEFYIKEGLEKLDMGKIQTLREDGSGKKKIYKKK